ncbi:BBP7 family outer membrane beta-barrel protein [Roseimaritima sediminicola]|uniref:BBP7 family outer membrane beta-barrel protein n=1 Tax=Roseimaritima sediminicola TaxID=2662066 RepID=UPI00129848FE|nr:BBP7 family outer membrane beta-barrel protein [Roseimaritima sediminicola]
MQTKQLSWIAALILLATIATTATAQQPRRRAPSKAERVARAKWQPVRTVQNTEHAPLPPSIKTESVPAGEIVLGPVHQGQTVHPGETVYQDGAIYHEGDVYHDGGLYDHGGGYPGGLACDAAGGGCDALPCNRVGCRECGPVGGAGWRPCITLCAPQDGWASFEYLLWFQDGMDLPPLVTTSAAGTARAEAGVLNTAGVRTLYGDDEILTDSISGGRLRVGIWLDACHDWAVEGEFFATATESDTFTQTSPQGGTILARPFFNVLTGAEDSELVSFPDVIGGTVTVQAETQLQGAGVTFSRLMACGDGCGDTIFCGLPQRYTHRLEGLIGYRWLELDDSLSINEALVAGDGTFNITDRFDARSQFNGVDFGGRYRRTRGWWTLDLMAKLAIGTTRENVTINGTTVTTTAGQSTTARGGLLAQRTNIGTYKRDRFAVVPELGAKVGYQLTERLRATVGYTFIYWSNVVRAGDQISRDLNPNLLPPEADPFSGAERPAFAFRDSDYWVHGISFGGEYRW